MPFPLDHYIEASHVDYKERLEEKKPRSWLKSVSAFANTEGGHLIFGVKNEPREVVGLENPQAVVSRLTELIKVRIDPTPRYRVREVEIEGKSFSRSKSSFFKFLNVAASSVKLTSPTR